MEQSCSTFLLRAGRAVDLCWFKDNPPTTVFQGPTLCHRVVKKENTLCVKVSVCSSHLSVPHAVHVQHSLIEGGDVQSMWTNVSKV